MSQTSGVLYIHSAPAPLCPHVEWAVSGVFGVRVELPWCSQPAARASYRAELAWRGRVGTAAKVASALKGWQKLRFEVTEESTADSEGCRYSYTPNLGVFYAVTGLHGDIQVSEDRLRRALVNDSLGGQSIYDSIDELLGGPWDAELELFRHAGESPVRMLHEVV